MLVPGRRFELLKANAGGFTVRSLWPLGQPGVLGLLYSSVPESLQIAWQNGISEANQRLTNAVDGVAGNLAHGRIGRNIRELVQALIHHG